MESTQKLLERYTAPGYLFEKQDDGSVCCVACGHRCSIPPGQSGNCRVRFNRDGILQVPFGYVSGIQCDPIEKKPFFHVRPGATAMSFGMLGCNFHCMFCQNWRTSQVPREQASVPYFLQASPEEIVRAAREHGADYVVSTYNEPLITSEWAVAVFREAKSAGLMTAYVSNGCGTPAALEYLLPWVDAFNIDLKCFDAARYRRLGGRLQPVLDTIVWLHARGVWVEIVTLLVPGFNDSAEEIRKLTEFVRGVSPDIPWHVTAFRKNYRMTGVRDTAPEDLTRAVGLGREIGLRYIYAGNLPGDTGDLENTRCPDCGGLLVERNGFRVLRCDMTAQGLCPYCGSKIPGRWS